MTQAELRRIGIVLYGKRAWQTRMAEELGVNASTVRRWVAGTVTIPNPVAVALHSLSRESAREK